MDFGVGSNSFIKYRDKFIKSDVKLFRKVSLSQLVYDALFTKDQSELVNSFFKARVF